MKVLTIAVTDTNADPDPINYPIPGNDDSITSIEYFLTEIIEAYATGKVKSQNNRVSQISVKTVFQTSGLPARRGQKNQKNQNPRSGNNDLPEFQTALKHTYKKFPNFQFSIL